MFPARALATLFLLLLTLPACSQEADYGTWLADAFPADGPGVTAILVRDGEVLFRGAAGMANLELGVPMHPDHVLRIGSITKQFTAAAILMLQDRGLLHVDDPVSEHLPYFPTQGHDITIEHLLTHTAGLYDFTDIPGYWRGDLIRTDVGVGDIIALFAGKPMRFAPGTDFRYANSGYTLLGAIIERVSGQSYADFLRTEIFEPLGMHDTQYGGRHLVPRRADGYQRSGDGYVNALPISMTHAYSAGALISTVDDLARWNAALFGGEVLSEAALRAMTSAATLDDGTHIEYGYGFYVRKRDGLQVISHSGGIHGFASSAVWLPEQGIYAAVLVNLENSGQANELVWKLARDAAGRTRD